MLPRTRVDVRVAGSDQAACIAAWVTIAMHIVAALHVHAQCHSTVGECTDAMEQPQHSPGGGSALGARCSSSLNLQRQQPTEMPAFASQLLPVWVPIGFIHWSLPLKCAHPRVDANASGYRRAWRGDCFRAFQVCLSYAHQGARVFCGGSGRTGHTQNL